MKTLIQTLTPVIQASAARALCAGGRASAMRNVREEVRDLTQEVFGILFADNGKVLRAWSPDGGASLRGFISVVAKRRTISILRSRTRNPWQEDPTDCADLVNLKTTPAEEGRLQARQLLDAALTAVGAQQSERGRELLQLLIVEDLDNDEVQKRMNMSRDAVYQWRSRLLKSVRSELELLMAQGG